jgi:ribosome modulation factor
MSQTRQAQHHALTRHQRGQCGLVHGVSAEQCPIQIDDHRQATARALIREQRPEDNVHVLG